MPDTYPYPDPVVETTRVQEIARDLVVIPDRHIPLVPNVGVVGGSEAVLVIDTGMGPRNADRVLAFAADHARGRKLYLTTTHFHPEHAFGAQVFAGNATYLINRVQAEDLATRGPGYLEQFRGLGAAVARELEDVTLAAPDVIYDDSYDLDLGGRIVHLRSAGRGHTKGDQVVTVPDAGALFTGDLVETGQFAIFPWFPPYDTDVSGTGWIQVVKRLAASHPELVVPGHGDVGGVERLTDVGDYLQLLRDETWVRRDSAMSEATIVEEVTAVMIQKHPEWEGREWIQPGVGCLCTEYPS